MSLVPETTRRGGAIRHWFMTAHVGPLHGGALWGVVGVILAFLAISIPQYGQPYVIDEAVFPYVADGILKNGAPFYYNGEFRPHDLGLWHTPLYDYLLAAQVGLFGMSTYAVRAFGAICVIASLLFLLPTLRRIAPDIKQYAYVILAALFMLNPLVISDALVPDIDGTLGLLEVSMALWVATVLAQKVLSRRLVLGLFGLAVLVVLTKFEIAGIVGLIVAGGALVSSRDRWWKLMWLVIAFAVGTVVALGLFFGLGAILKYDARAPFDYLFGSLGSRAPGRSGLHGAFTNLMIGSGSNVVWIGPALFVTAIVAFIWVLVARPRAVSRPLAGLMLAASVLIVLGYSYITAAPFGFPKYTAVVVPGLAVVATLLVTIASPLPPARSARGRGATVALVSAYVIVLLVGVGGAFVIMRRYERVQGRQLGELVLLALVTFVCVLVATAVLVLLLRPADGASGRERLRRPLLIALVSSLVFTPIMVQTASSVQNATSPYATRYYYREAGMAPFLKSADKIIPRHAKIIAPKDVGLQLGRPYYEDAGLLPLSPSKLAAKIKELHAPYLVTRSLWDYSEAAFPQSFDVLRKYYTPILHKTGEDFTLWKLKSAD
ncbi:MAG: hypothetical protein JWN36_2063 [Microbacteriaceae bacterium]|nr:hypothetical protein [Microbacteriaceae bacterium]